MVRIVDFEDHVYLKSRRQGWISLHVWWWMQRKLQLKSISLTNLFKIFFFPIADHIVLNIFLALSSPLWVITILQAFHYFLLPWSEQYKLSLSLLVQSLEVCFSGNTKWWRSYLKDMIFTIWCKPCIMSLNCTIKMTAIPSRMHILKLHSDILYPTPVLTA